MPFSMVDRILACEPGRRIEAVKVLSRSEEYLLDHFPSFPIMPGVLMLEALVQSASWLLAATGGFEHPAAALREVRAVRYGSMVRPGETLSLSVELSGIEGDEASFKGTGRVGDRSAVVGRFTLRRVRLRDLNPALAEVEERMGRLMRDRFSALSGCGREW